MRADVMIERINSARSRLGLPTPCPVCSDPRRPTYCDDCIAAVASYLDITPETLRRLVDPKRVGVSH